MKNSLKSLFRLCTVLLLYLFLGGCQGDIIEQCWTLLGPKLTSEDDIALGYSVSCSNGSEMIATGSPNHDSERGLVQVFKFVEGNTTDNDKATWMQIGGNLTGTASGDRFGSSISLNNDGTKVAIGAPNHDSERGHVQVYMLSGTTWVQVGSDINGTTAGDYFGSSISLSEDGTKIAIGAPNHDSDRGHVQVYEFTGGSWMQLGADIDGTATGDLFGTSVSLTQTGKYVAGGAPHHDSNKGHVKTYELIAGSWMQLGANIEGTSEGDYFGSAISLSESSFFDTLDLLIGAPIGNYARYLFYSMNDAVWSDTIFTLNGDENGDAFGSSVFINDTLTQISQFTAQSKTKFVIGARTGNYVKIIEPEITLEGTNPKQIGNIITFSDLAKQVDTLDENDESTFGMSICLGYKGNRVIIGDPINNCATVYQLTDCINPIIYQMYVDAFLSPTATATEAPTMPGTAFSSGSAGPPNNVSASQGPATRAVNNKNQQQAAADQLSQLVFNLISDTNEATYEIQGGPHNGRFFKASGFLGTARINGTQLRFNQNNANEVTGILLESDGTTVVDAAAKLTMAVIDKAMFTPPSMRTAGTTITLTNMTGGTITSGMFTLSTVTLTLVSDTAINTFPLDVADFPQFGATGITFTCSGITGTLAQTGMLSPGTPGANTLTGGEITGATATGDLTIIDGPYAGFYTGVMITSATISGATVTGTATTTVFSGTDVTAGTFKSPGTLDIKFVNIPTFTPDSSPAFTISGGDLDTATFRSTSGTIYGHITSGTAPGAIGFTQTPGSPGGVLGSIPSPGTGASAGFTGTFTSVPLIPLFTTFTGVTIAGSYDASGNIFTATSATGGTLVDAGLTFVITASLAASSVTTAFAIVSGTYGGETFTLKSSPTGNDSLSGGMAGGTFNAAGTTYGGVGSSLVLDQGCREGTISGGYGDGTVTGNAVGVPVITLVDITTTGSFTGLNFTATAITAGTSDQTLSPAPPSNVFTLGDTCSP